MTTHVLKLKKLRTNFCKSVNEYLECTPEISRLFSHASPRKDLESPRRTFRFSQLE